MIIKAAVSRHPDAPFTVEALELDSFRADEILVRMLASGLCHTDLVVKALGSPDGGGVVLGHEGAGVVEAIGADVDGVRVGEHVLLSFSSCGTCEYCRASRPTYCLHFGALNMPSQRPDGSSILTSAGAPIRGSFFGQSSFASYALVHRSNAIVIPTNVDPVSAAPLGCGVQTGAGAVFNVLRPSNASTFVVYGAGCVGMASLMAAKAVGVSTIVAVDPVSKRRALAMELGATAAIDPAGVDVVAAVREVTEAGASHALDTTGVPDVIASALSELRPLGMLAVVGLGTADVTVNVQDMVSKGKTIRGCIEGDAVPSEFIPKLIDLYKSGLFPLDRLVTPYPIEEINLAVADAKSGRTLKAVLTFASS